MAIGTPALLGDAHSAASSTTLAITTGSDAPAGSLVVVAAGIRSNTGITGVTDSAGNTYTALNGALTSAGYHLKAFWSLTAFDLPNAGTITVTYAAAVSAVKLASAASVSGIAASPLDQNGAGASANSTTPSIASGALAQASEIVFGFLYAQGAPTITEAPGFTALDTVTSTDALHWAWQIVSATSAVTYAPTLGSSVGWACNIASFEGAAGGGLIRTRNAQPFFYLEW